MPGSNGERVWLDRQVAAYRKAAPRYRKLAVLLDEVLRRTARDLAPLAIVQARAKEIASFAEKALRKRAKYAEPVRQFTDLAGARVITRNREEVERFCDFIETSFAVDWDNSVDARQRLRPTEFGYRSVHYIVSLRPDVDYGIPMPAELFGLKAEVQVRTMVEHAWADFAHDVSYKSAFDLPDAWKREIAVIAAELEDIDRSFSRIESGLRTYAASFGAYMTEAEIGAEAARLETVLEHDPENASLAHRIGKLAMAVGDWQRAVAVMDPFVDGDPAGETGHDLARDLGIALCTLHREAPDSDRFRRGRSLLERAARPEHGDAAAMAALAQTWRRIDDALARDLYRAAFEQDPTDWQPLGAFIEYEVRRTRDAAVLDGLRPAMAAAAARCEAQAAVGVNLPWALFGLGRLRLLGDRPYEALDAYARGLAACAAAFPIEHEIAALDALRPIRSELPGIEWTRRLLLTGLAAGFPTPARTRRVRRLASRPFRAFSGPVVIVVGGTDPRLEAEMTAYRDLVAVAFRDFAGTVISGGTSQGIPGLVGEAAAASESLHAVGYLPGTLPEDATPDSRYGEIRATAGNGFSPLEPLQNWIDIVASGIEPAAVRVLGINGGDIAAIEYRIALALGATVGIVAESGRAAARLTADERWTGIGRRLLVPRDPQTVRSFVRPSPGGTGIEDPLGRVIHDAYRVERARDRAGEDPAMQEWDRLPRDLRESNRAQAAAIAEKLAAVGYRVVAAPGPPEPPFEFSDAQVETMAEMEHGRWVAERLAAGWTWGERRDAGARTSPYLVAWADLPDDIREYDRETVRKIPRFLAAAGLAVEPVR